MNEPSKSNAVSLTRQGMTDAGKGYAVFHDRAEHGFRILLWTPAA